MNICWKHNTVSAWGCPECLDEKMQKITDDAIAEMCRKLSDAFAAVRPTPSKEHGDE